MDAVTTTFILTVAAFTTVLAVPAVIQLDDNGENVCRGKKFSTVCTTVSASGFLRWNSSREPEDVVTFDSNNNNIGDTDTLPGSITLTLDNIEMVSGTNAAILTSTASGKIMKKTGITCSDGDDSQSIAITTKSPSSPLWAHSACRFSQDSVQLFWNIPSTASECCVHYAVRLSTNGNVTYSNTTSLNINVSFGDNPINATVYCIDYLGENTTSQEITIDSSTTPEVTIETLTTSCTGNTNYNISWTTNHPNEGVCTPPITMSTITCTTSSTHQSSNNTRSRICTVPANETINAIVTVTNEAGVTTSKSKSADAQALTCQECDQLSSPAGIAAITMGLLLFILIVVCIIILVSALVVCIVRKYKTGSLKVDGDSQ